MMVEVNLEFGENFLEKLNEAAVRETSELGDYIQRSLTAAIDVTAMNYIMYLEQQLGQLKYNEQSEAAPKETEQAEEDEPAATYDFDGLGFHD